MRVLHVSTGNLYGGVEAMLTTLARAGAHAPEMRSEFALCFGGRQWEELAVSGAVVHSLGAVRMSRPWTVLRARHALRSLLARERFDVVVCHNPWIYAVAAPAVRSSRVGLVLFLHGALADLHFADRLAARTTPDLVLANSHFTEGTVARLYSAVPTDVVYPPVPPPSGFGGRASDRAAVRSEIGAARGVPVVIQVSRMEKLKGQELHLRALATLPASTSWECWQVGGPQTSVEREYFARLRGLTTELGISRRVRWLGERTDVRRLLAAADIYCQPNLTPDAFGITFVEALYAGLPVVTSAIGGAMEIVDRSCGILVPPDERGQLATVLDELFRDKARRARLAAAAPARAAEVSDPASQLQRLQRALAPVAARVASA